MDTVEGANSDTTEAARQLRQIKLILVAVIVVVVIGGATAFFIHQHQQAHKKDDCMALAIRADGGDVIAQGRFNSLGCLD